MQIFLLMVFGSFVAVEWNSDALDRREIEDLCSIDIEYCFDADDFYGYRLPPEHFTGR